jgi:glycerol-3-phosphate acyltransferase PlsY
MSAKEVGAVNVPRFGGPIMQTVTMIVDFAKSVFQVHGTDAEGKGAAS